MAFDGRSPVLKIKSVREDHAPLFLLDALRGLAALMVLVYHAHDLVSARQWLPSTFLAVDVFFVLSGFVLAFAYDRRLAEGMTWRRFMALRLARLYPAYFGALSVAVFALGGAMLWGSSIIASDAALMWSAFFGLVMLPTPPFLTGKDALYPTNPAAWSIFYELMVNVVFAIAFTRLRGWILAALIAVSAVCLGWVAIMHGTVDAGVEWRTMEVGVARVVFSFFVGVFLQRGCRTGRLQFDAPWWLPLVAMCCSFCLHFDGYGQVLYELACIVVLYPLLICMAASAKAGPTVQRLSLYAGTLSYPIYIFHTPLLFLLTGLMVRVADAPVASLRPWGGCVVLVAIVGLSVVVQRWVERPALVYLRRRIVTRPSMIDRFENLS